MFIDGNKPGTVGPINEKTGSVSLGAGVRTRSRRYYDVAAIRKGYMCGQWLVICQFFVVLIRFIQEFAGGRSVVN